MRPEEQLGPAARTAGPRRPPPDPAGPRLAVLCGSRLLGEALAEALASRRALRAVVAERIEDVAELQGAEPDVVVFDGSSGDAARVAQSLRVRLPAARLVAVSIRDQRALLALAEAGASGFLPAGSSLDEVADAVAAPVDPPGLSTAQIAAALSRRLYALARAGNGGSRALLTPREEQIALLLERGLSNKEIARRLELGVPTVKNHVHNALEKIGARSRAELGAWARRSGLADTGAP